MKNPLALTTVLFSMIFSLTAQALPDDKAEKLQGQFALVSAQVLTPNACPTSIKVTYHCTRRLAPLEQVGGQALCLEDLSGRKTLETFDNLDGWIWNDFQSKAPNPYLDYLRISNRTQGEQDSFSGVSIFTATKRCHGMFRGNCQSDPEWNKKATFWTDRLAYFPTADQACFYQRVR